MFRSKCQLFIGWMRYIFILYYYSVSKKKTFLRKWFTSKGNDVTMTIKWKFKIGQEIQIKSTRSLGMICHRWIQNGTKLYEIKIGRYSFIYYEPEIEKTYYTVRSRVKIQEVKFKNLAEGHYCALTRRKYWPYIITK